jgi:hypothetical protein
MAAIELFARTSRAALLLVPLIVVGCIGGQGPVTTETRETRAFARIEVGAGVRLELSIGPAGPIEVSAQANVLPAIGTDVSGDTLRIEAREDYTTTVPVTVTVTVPAIHAVSLSGGAAATISGLDSDAIELSVKGGARATVVGTTGTVTLTADGGSTVDLGALTAGEVSVTLAGGSAATVSASGTVHGFANGGSQLTVRGSAVVSVEESGGASVVTDR